jgi:hypothetical protein
MCEGFFAPAEARFPLFPADKAVFGVIPDFFSNIRMIIY